MGNRIPVVILTSKGPRHSYFCRELARHFDVKGIVLDVRYGFWHRLSMFLKAYGAQPSKLLKTLGLKKQIRPYEERDEKTEKDFFCPENEAGNFPAGIPVLKSKNPNSLRTQQWIRQFSPDVLIVFGTRLIDDEVLALPKYGALNLHTGLSPYYRGGQCTFWSMDEGDFEHVGVTIHHLVQKIDGGDIVETASAQIVPGDTVRSVECRLVKAGTEKMIKAVTGLVQGTAQRIPQTLKGKLFLSKMFTLEKRLAFEKKLEEGWIEKNLKEPVSSVSGKSL